MARVAARHALTKFIVGATSSVGNRDNFALSEGEMVAIHGLAGIVNLRCRPLRHGIWVYDPNSQ